MCHDFILFFWCSCALQVGMTTIVLKNSHVDLHATLTRSNQLTFPVARGQGHRLPRLRMSSSGPPEVLSSLTFQLPLYSCLRERDLGGSSRCVTLAPASDPRKASVSQQGTWTVFSWLCHCPFYLERPNVSLFPLPPPTPKKLCDVLTCVLQTALFNREHATP